VFIRKGNRHRIGTGRRASGQFHAGEARHRVATQGKDRFGNGHLPGKHYLSTRVAHGHGQVDGDLALLIELHSRDEIAEDNLLLGKEIEPRARGSEAAFRQLDVLKLETGVGG
jgi:hypothetical protein